jgi:D-xylose transport system substrate-binding protein
MTVYKAIKLEADEAAALAVSLAKGETVNTGQKVTDPSPKKDVPAKLLKPGRHHQGQHQEPSSTTAFVTKAELCTGAYGRRLHCRWHLLIH